MASGLREHENIVAVGLYRWVRMSPFVLDDVAMARLECDHYDG